MSINRPSLNTLIERKKSDIESSMPGVDMSMPGSVLGVLAAVLSGSDHSLYGYQDYIADQINPATATAENMENYARWLCGGMQRNPAAPATGVVVFSGADNAVIPLGTIVQSSSGIDYITTTGVVIINGAGLVPVTSAVTGQLSNLVGGAQLFLVSPIAGVNGVAVVAADGVTGGAYIESDEQLLSRMSDYVARKPNGGSVNDYKAWAKQVPGITRAWVMPHWLGVGRVGVYVVRDNDVPIIPSAGEIAAVQAHIDQVKPVKATVTVYAPAAVTQTMTIAISPDTPAVRDAVKAEIEAMFLQRAVVEDGNGSGVILLSHIRAAVSAAAGENDNNVISPAGNIIPNPGEIVRLGAITWQAI